MGAEAVSTAFGSSGRSGSGSTKSGKPRPGTGGHGRRALEGKGPTPPAAMRPGHPAQRRAAAAAGPRSRIPPPAPRRRPRALGGSRGPRRADTPSASARTGRGAAAPSGSSARAPRGSGDAAEFVAGRNPVVESLRAAVPAVALYVGTRVQHDERISEAIKLAADRGVAVLEAGAGRARPAHRRRAAPGPGAPRPPLRLRAPRRPARPGRRRRPAAADRRAGRRHRPAQPGGGGAIGRRVRRPRGRGPVPPRRRRHRGRLEGVRGRAGPGPGGPRRQPGPHPGLLPGRRRLRGRPGRGRRHTRSATWSWPPPRWSWSSAPRAAACPASSPRPATSWSAFPIAGPHRIPQRRRSRRHRPLRSRRHPLPPHHPLTRATT